jgi:hypothetical protein
MDGLKMVSQGPILTRQLSPAEYRVDVRTYPAEDSELMYPIHGFSLAPRYSLKQLREIERSAKRKLDLQYSRTYAKGWTKSL